MMKQYATIFALSLVLLLSSCSNASTEDKSVVIYSSAEEYRNTHLLARLEEEFPDYDISLQYHPSGNNGAKLQAEGTETEADIVVGLDTGYMEQLGDLFTDLSAYDRSMYVDSIIPDHHNYAIWEIFSGAIVVNPGKLEEKGLDVPENYADLLDPQYKGLISMPNPKSSGTGYMFYKNLVNVWGEEEAIAYFDQLSDNVLQFTTSGSGPVNQLVTGEVAIGLGMTFHAATEMEKGVDLDIYFFEEGSPYSTTGFGMIHGKQERPEVVAVFDFLYNTLIYEDKELFSPEIIFKDQVISLETYPDDIHYGDMTGMLDFAEKERLLALWVH